MLQFPAYFFKFRLKLQFRRTPLNSKHAIKQKAKTLLVNNKVFTDSKRKSLRDRPGKEFMPIKIHSTINLFNTISAENAPKFPVKIINQLTTEAFQKWKGNLKTRIKRNTFSLFSLLFCFWVI